MTYHAHWWISPSPSIRWDWLCPILCFERIVSTLLFLLNEDFHTSIFGFISLKVERWPTFLPLFFLYRSRCYSRHVCVQDYSSWSYSIDSGWDILAIGPAFSIPDASEWLWCSTQIGILSLWLSHETAAVVFLLPWWNYQHLLFWKPAIYCGTIDWLIERPVPAVAYSIKKII